MTAHAPGADSDLRYFAEFVPRAAGVSPLPVDYAHLVNRYGGQSGLDLDGLRNGAAMVADVVVTMRAQCSAQSRALTRVAAAWHGAAADVAVSGIARRLERAYADTDAMSGVQRALEEAASVIDDAVRAKSDLVASVDPSAIGGRSVREIDGMLAAALGESPDSTAESWLREVLVPQVRAHVDAVLDLCAAVERVVLGAHRMVDDAMVAVDPAPYRRTTEPESTFAPADPVQGASVPPVGADPGQCGCDGAGDTHSGIDSDVGADEAGTGAESVPPADPEQGATETAAPAPVEEQAAPGAEVVAEAPAPQSGMLDFGPTGEPVRRRDAPREPDRTEREPDSGAELATAGPL
ncbi:hypothetical protein FK531_18580 [Rhodococcus spelaei]|uniref:Uncharacterized protein n=1 Tax=Rhodococcus spelaei TaxID=2546320 RepID=A0A541B0R2_9NOCA|nr:hypothetical protein [Rhodococcus spelaei]TQF65896.1 hypothetical protein FK531_18580 [Rhodococcus spelaei]